MLPNEANIYWPEHVATIVHAYNCTKSNSTGFYPYFLLHERHPMLPVDIEIGVRTPDIKFDTTDKYVTNPGLD